MRLLPTETVPKFTLPGEAVRAPAVTPDPDRVTVNGVVDALLVIETLPVTAPVVVGAKLTLMVRLWPASRVAGRVSPLRPNAAPVTPA